MPVNDVSDIGHRPTGPGAAERDWVVTTPGGGAPAARLFCFPHAGGSYLAFSRWREQAPAGLEVVSFCYPGRLRRIREQPLSDLPSLVREVHAAIAGMLDLPFVLLGHSLGALVAFELARRLRRHGEPQPVALVSAGHGAPHLPRRTPDLHQLPVEQLVRELRALQGLPAEVEHNQEFLQLMMPVIRAELHMHETYVYDDEPPLDCAIVAATGWSDPQVSPPEAEAWSLHTRSEFCFRAFPDGHFFLAAAQDELLAVIGRQLSERRNLQPQ